MKSNPFLLFIRLSRPWFLIGGLLTFSLGTGIANYLGYAIDSNVYLLGQLWVTGTQLTSHYFNEYFEGEAGRAKRNRTWFSGGSGVLGDGPNQLPRVTALLAAYTVLTLVALATLGLIVENALNPTVILIMSLGFLGALFYSLPPISLASSGYGELLTAVLIANLVPAFAFSLQTGELHRLLAMVTFPLTGLHAAGILAFEFPNYATDLKFETTNLLVRLGWQRAMQAHNLFLVVSYILLGAALLFGLPLGIALPVLLTLPLAALQIWYMQRIGQGLKPNWSALTLNAVVIMAAAVYLFTYAFWIR